MTVYVDDMYKVPMGQFRNMKMSHMIADTEEELHAMAAKIGVKRQWYQGDHYDVSYGMRLKAIEFGAQAITMRELGKKSMELRRAKSKRLVEEGYARNAVQEEVPTNPRRSRRPAGD